MDLKCYVNGKEYKDKMVQGIVVSEEYNETLDSATVILSQVPKIKDLRPYDDFYIYEGEFKGYDKSSLEFGIAEIPSKLNDFSFVINELFYDNGSCDVDLFLKVQNVENIPNFYIDVNYGHAQEEYQATYFAEFVPANPNNPPYIKFSLVGESQHYPKTFVIEQKTENYFDGSFKTNYAFQQFSNMRINDEMVPFNFLLNIKNYNDFAGVYELNNMYCFNSIKIPDKVLFSKTYNSFFKSTLSLRKIYFKIEKTEVEEGVFEDVETPAKTEILNVSANFEILNEKSFVLKILELDENFNIYFNYDERYNCFTTSSSKKVVCDNDDLYNFYYLYLDNIIEFFVPVYSNTTNYEGFYRHFLVDQYTEEMLNIDEDPNKILYKYKIELFSETKKLETIQIPNFSVTQPQHGGEKKNIYSYMLDVVDMYSPVYKVSIGNDNRHWTYKKKYTIDLSLEETFKNMYCPDFTLNNPNLRDVLAQLMLVADRIPYVEDDVIKAMDITERNGNFNRDVGEITNVVSSRTSSNHCDNLKRTYSNALSQENTAHTVEYIGFRNSSSGMLTLENLKLETRFPIYKINKIYMCYYKKANIVSKTPYKSGISYPYGMKVTYNNEMYKCIAENGSSETFELSEWEKITRTTIFLCKQDISKLVLLEQERNLISQDWTDFKNAEKEFTSVDDMAKYKFCTLGYNIGSNEINGFGTKMEYFDSPYWDKTATYIQNIVCAMDTVSAFGIYNEDYFNSELNEDETISKIKINNSEPYTYFKELFITPFSNPSLAFKSLVFQVDYNAFYNGTIYHSKDTDRDDIVINDNSSSSLTLLEQDGIHQKEKANRFGNKTITISARYKNIEEMQCLGSVYEYDGEKDIIIYHRQYSIFDNVITCAYSGSHDYVLKNYFTSVYAKHRPYNLMSYNESVRRSENRKMYVMLSKENVFLENENRKMKLHKFGTGSFVENMLSFFKPEQITDRKGVFKKLNKINYGFYTYDKHKYLSDINSFTSGNSVCFNLSMYDNVSAGLYLDKDQLEPTKWLDFLPSEQENLYVRGTMQKWYLTVDNAEDGRAREMGFYIGHKEDYPYTKQLFSNDEDVKRILTDEFFAYPKINDANKIVNVIGNNYLLNKDNKELIDMTFQFELISDDFYFSNWMLKLSDLISTNNKFDNNVYESSFPNEKSNEIYAFSTKIKGKFKSSASGETGLFYYRNAYAPTILLSIKDSIGIKVEDKIEQNVYTAKNFDGDPLIDQNIYAYSLYLQKVEKIDDDFIYISATQSINARLTGLKKQNYFNKITIKFKKIKSFGITHPSDGYTFYCNCLFNDETADWTELEKFLNAAFAPGTMSSHHIIGTFADETTDVPVGDSVIDIKTLSPYSDFVIENPFEDRVFKYNTATYAFNIQNDSNEIVYHKNLYLATGKDKIDKNYIYKKFTLDNSDIDFDDTRVPSDVFSIEKSSNGTEQLVVKIPADYIENNVSSIQVWYLDNDDPRYVENDIFNFVCGVNIENATYNETDGYYYIKYNISVLSTRDLRVFDENHMEIGKVKNIANSSDFETEQTYEKNEEQQ